MCPTARDTQDSRRVLVYVTDAGLELFNQLQSRVDQHHASMGALLGPRNARQLERLLMLLIEEAERPSA
jgi:MarR family transcriptional regulator, organic hydroperoxide resistance regulator